MCLCASVLVSLVCVCRPWLCRLIVGRQYMRSDGMRWTRLIDCIAIKRWKNQSAKPLNPRIVHGREWTCSLVHVRLVCFNQIVYSSPSVPSYLLYRCTSHNHTLVATLSYTNNNPPIIDRSPN